MTKSRETLNQVLSIMTVAFNEISLGMAIGWLAPVLTKFQDPKGDFKATLDESSWLASLEYIGEIPGALFTAFALDILGRKTLLTSVAFIFFLMWVVNAVANSFLVICVMRFVMGFFVGINNGTNSTYLAENSSPKIRGVFGALCITFYYIGLLAEYSIAAYFSYTVTSIVNAVITFLLFLSVLWMKEPVQFLLMKGNLKQAEKNFAWLHGGNSEDDEIYQEFERIKQNVQLENLKKTSLKSTLTSPANYRSLFIVITIYALVGCTGYFPVVTYASIAFSDSDMLTSNEFTILFGIFQLLAIVPTSFFVNRFNRRFIILLSYSLIALCHAATTMVYYIQSNIFEIPYFQWLIFASITLYASIYAAMYPVIFVIRGELFPLSVKATGGCLAVIFLSVTTTLMTKIFLHATSSFGIEMNFFMYFLFSIIIIVFVYFFLPETKNKSLIEIQEMLEKTEYTF